MLSIRKAAMADIDLLVKLRLDYLSIDFKFTPEEEIQLVNQLREYFPKHLDSERNDFIAGIAEIDGIVAGTAYMMIDERPANPKGFMTGKTALILNVLTYPEYRRKGIATKILEMLIDEAKKANVAYIELSASVMGKPVYEKLGFEEKTNSHYTNMKLKLI